MCTLKNEIGNQNNWFNDNNNNNINNYVTKFCNDYIKLKLIFIDNH